MLILAPTAIDAQGDAVTVNLTGLGGQAQKALIANESVWALQVFAGGVQKWIRAWDMDVIDVSGTTQMRFVPSLLTSTANAPSSSVLITLAFAGEDFPGQYPAPADRVASISAGSVTVQGTATVAIAGTGNTVQLAGGSTVAISGTPTVQFAAGQAVTITAGTVNIQNAPGTNLSVVTTQTHLGTFQGAGGGPTNVPIPAGVHVIGVLNVGSTITALTISGHTTGTQYNVNPPIPVSALAVNGGPTYYQIASAEDTSVDVSWTGLNVNAKFFLYAVPDTTIVYVQANPGTTLPADVTDRATRLLGQLAADSSDAILSFPMNLVVGAGATQQVFAAVAGKTIKLLGIYGQIATAAVAAVQLEDDAGIIAAKIRTDVAMPIFVPLNGFALTVGHLCRLNNPGGVASGTLAGTVLAVQK